MNIQVDWLIVQTDRRHLGLGVRGEEGGDSEGGSAAPPRLPLLQMRLTFSAGVI